MTLAVLIIAAAVALLVLLRIWWLTQDTRWHLQALYEKVDRVDFDVRYIHNEVVPAGKNPRYPISALMERRMVE